MSNPALFEQAVALQAAGRLAEAEALCRQIVAAQPGHSGALLLLGALRVQAGDSNGALALLRRSLGIAPDVPLAHFWHAVALAQLGQTVEAVRSYARAGELDPNFAEAHYNRGQLLLTMGRPGEALGAFERTLVLRPGLKEAQLMRAAALAQTGQRDGAIAALDRMLATNPHFVAALNMRAELKGGSGRFAEALADSERSLAIDPNQAQALNARGNALFELHRMEEAEQAFERALSLDPKAISALMMRGAIRTEFGRFAEALEDFERAAQLAPNDAHVHNNRGNALRLLDRSDEALACYAQALAIDPRFGKAYYGRSLVLHKLGQIEDALAECNQALAIDPSLALNDAERVHLCALMCDWREREIQVGDLARRIRQGRTISPWIVITVADDPELQWLAARSSAPSAPAGSTDVHVHSHPRLRVAYLSPDFGEHPVGYQLVELFERHDKTKFETFGVCLRDTPESAIRTRISQAFEHFETAAARSDADIAAWMKAQEIDIAVDLAGHTEASRPRIFSFRPAPIAVNYAGYPGTTGSTGIDYVLADAVVVPPENEAYFSEKIVRLPDCFFPADTRAPRGETPSRAQEGLAEAAFVFCAFNNAYKLTPEMFDIWMRLLQAVDGSVLWLSIGNETARGNLRNEARARGVSEQRLVFAARTAERAQHLARLSLADVFLDSLPYNAHSTASDMLWAGVLPVTCMGRSLAARVASSMLMSLGMDELIARDLKEYERIALELAQSPARLSAVRGKLAAVARGSALFDMARLARQIEAAYEAMWKLHANGRPPQSFTLAGR